MAGIFGKLFGRTAPERKESAAGRVMVMNPGQAVWSDRNYKAFSEEAYRRNVIAFRSIQAIADAVASVPWTVWRAKQELESHPLLDLIKTLTRATAEANTCTPRSDFFCFQAIATRNMSSKAGACARCISYALTE